MILDDSVPVVIPPIYNDVITAKLASSRTWNTATLKSAKTRLEDALQRVESPYPTAAGLTIVVVWRLPYFRTRVPNLWKQYGPVDKVLTTDPSNPQLAVLDAIRSPSDPATVVLEDNVWSSSFAATRRGSFATWSARSSRIRRTAHMSVISSTSGASESALSGRGFGGENVGKKLAVELGVPGADQIPARSQLMMGFTSTQPAALGPDNLISFETLPGVTNQWPSGYFAAGCAMHVSHLSLDLTQWYGFDYAQGGAHVLAPQSGAGRREGQAFERPRERDDQDTISDSQNGINGVMAATHRQNFLVPPRSRRSFPLVDLLK